jgi:RNA polymerase sigma-70 factor (ECF subfamily)
MTTTPPPTPEAREEAIRALIATDVAQATELAIRAYGPELIGWLCSILPSEADAHDAFSRMSENLWRTLPRFDGRCSVRTWCYMLARQAAYYVRSRPATSREVLVSNVPSLVASVTHVWNTTHAGRQLAENVYAEIRRQLEDDDQTLLVLRVDRDLAWRDIAIVMLGENADTDEVPRKAAALRKQFERVKEKLREMAAEKLRE